ncbi:alpha/beta fold hydrolase [Paracoccus sp. YIM 132242]|uniref:Alpha/beta fold hydrolase n=1 Tax=Paracoccus lichenicola TaxID=2665644 RepID=A0A6L6HTP6_9RHOB|nr:alpha/beta fold hydrolase [Paracoccus lichenicola]MTE00688.1 alpha/beta fold hydrolase [Paracoccus lichenicola]
MAPAGYRPRIAEPIWVAAQRDLSGDHVPQPWFSRIDVSVPPDRAPGDLAYPRPGGDPDREFLVTDGGRLADAGAFRRAIERDLAGRAPGNRDIMLFVHGYNYSFAEGVYRTAQLAHDLQLPGIHAHFSWPSRMKPYAYSGDRDGALYSRDGLVQTIDLLAQAKGRGKIVLMAHSMGGQLLMEALRQMALSGRRDLIGQIDGVILISPDLDLRLFRSQVRAIGPLPQPFVIITSPRDRALQLSALISDEPLRLGNIPDAQPVADLDVVVVDTGAFNTGYGHFNVADSPALQRILTRMRDLDRILPEEGGADPGLIGGAVSRVEQAVQVVLAPAF